MKLQLGSAKTAMELANAVDRLKRTNPRTVGMTKVDQAGNNAVFALVGVRGDYEVLIDLPYSEYRNREAGTAYVTVELSWADIEEVSEAIKGDVDFVEPQQDFEITVEDREIVLNSTAGRHSFIRTRAWGIGEVAGALAGDRSIEEPVATYRMEGEYDAEGTS